MYIFCPLNITQHTAINPLPTKVSTPLSENVQIVPIVSIFYMATIIFQHCLTFLGMEFTRASQVATGVLFHSSMTTSQSWWLLETLRSSTFHLRMPHRCSIGFRCGDMLGQSITFTLIFFSKAVEALTDHVFSHIGLYIGHDFDLIVIIFFFFWSVYNTELWAGLEGPEPAHIDSWPAQS